MNTNNNVRTGMCETGVNVLDVRCGRGWVLCFCFSFRLYAVAGRQAGMQAGMRQAGYEYRW